MYFYSFYLVNMLSIAIEYMPLTAKVADGAAEEVVRTLLHAFILSRALNASLSGSEKPYQHLRPTIRPSSFSMCDRLSANLFIR